MESNVEISNLLTPFVSVIKALNNEWNHLTESGLSDYLRVQTEKYYLTNDFLHPTEKVKFKDSYFPLKATYKELETNFDDINEVFGNYQNITLVGYAGSGKTTLLRHIFFKIISQKNKIPIVIELRSLNDYKGTFEDIVIEKVTKLRLEPTADLFRRTLSSGKYVFLLDGFDEIFSSKKSEINHQLDLFIDAYPENNFLITTRPGSGIERSARFFDFYVNDLENPDIINFINKLVFPQERRENIILVIDDKKNDNYKHYLKNPLLLSMFILAFKSHPEIPKRKSAFYRNVFDTLYSRHDGINKNSYPREKLSGLEKEDFEKILYIFSYISLTQGHITFTEEHLTTTLAACKKATDLKFNTQNLVFDLKTSISIIHQDGFEFTFPHRSLQEYFAAQFIANLPDGNKRAAYKKVIDSFLDSNDDGQNFYNLCLELDKISFISKIIIPELQTILNSFSKKTGADLYKAYLLHTTTGVSVGVDRKLILEKSSSNVDIRSLPVIIGLSPRDSNFFTVMLNIFEIYDLDKLINFSIDSGSNSQILLRLFNKHSPIFYDIDERLIFKNMDLVNEIFLENDVLSIINDIIDSTRKKLISLQEEISIQRNSIHDILNFKD